MNARITLLTILFATTLSPLAFAASGLEKLSKEEAQAWMQHLVPLPKQIQLVAKLTTTGNRIAVELTGTNDSLAGQALREIRKALQLGDNFPAPRNPGCTIKLQVAGPEANDLEKLKNADQAYQFIPMYKERELLVVALSDQGLYYGCKTLAQLIKANTQGPVIDIPFAKITDWPDLEDRGLWGADMVHHLRWLADRKMNYQEQIVGIKIDRNKQCSVYNSPKKQILIDEGPVFGINPVPAILHLEQLSSKGLFEAYPELQGKDATEGIICFSNPAISDVLSQWLVLWGQTPGVREVDVWMTENMAGKTSCQCDACKQHERAVLETQVILKAYDKAKQQVPGLGLRILLTEASESSNPKILELLPPDIKVWYYHSLLTYNTSRRPMIPDYVAKAAGKGRKIGVCPNLSSIINFWSPFTSPQFIHARMNEFVDKNLSSLLGYATPQLRYTIFNVEAAAEWSWNAKGRSPHEFALSYAIRQEYKDPELFAEWTDTLGDVSWDMYGSDWPSGEKRNQPGPVATRLKKGTLGALGKSLYDLFACPWGDIKSVKQLDDDVERADRAVELARKLDIPELIQESIVIQGYTQSLKALWELKAIVKPDGIADNDRDAAKRHFQAYVAGLAQSATALPEWEAALPFGKGKHPHMGRPVELINRSIDQMIAVAGELGVKIDRP